MTRSENFDALQKHAEKFATLFEEKANAMNIIGPDNQTLKLDYYATLSTGVLLRAYINISTTLYDEIEKQNDALRGAITDLKRAHDILRSLARMSWWQVWILHRLLKRNERARHG